MRAQRRRTRGRHTRRQARRQPRGDGSYYSTRARGTREAASAPPQRQLVPLTGAAPAEAGAPACAPPRRQAGSLAGRLREQRLLQQGRLLGDAKQQVHVLHRLARGALHQVVNHCRGKEGGASGWVAARQWCGCSWRNEETGARECRSSHHKYKQQAANRLIGWEVQEVLTREHDGAARDAVLKHADQAVVAATHVVRLPRGRAGRVWSLGSAERSLGSAAPACKQRSERPAHPPRNAHPAHPPRNAHPAHPQRLAGPGLLRPARTPSPWLTCGTCPAGSTCTKVSSWYRSCGTGGRRRVC